MINLMKYDVLSVGRITLDVFLFIDSTNQHFRLNQQTKELCIKLGDKAIVDRAEFLMGGNAANVSVAFSRLGLKAAVMAEIGSDGFSERIIDELKKEKVDTSFVKAMSGISSSFSMILNFNGERTIFEEVAKVKNDFSLENIDTKWIYLTSVCNNWEKVYDRVLEYAEKKAVKIAFNPGTKQLDAGLEKILKVLHKTEILFLNKEEAARLVNLPIDEEERIISLLKSKGVKNVVITEGLRGSFVEDESGNKQRFGVVKSNAVERTGAGDSYAAAFLAARIYGHSFLDAIKWGTYNAASVVSEIGSQPGLLTKKEMEKKINNE
ncbi:carbohydrate kinase family protein [Patescibacteria group bacterium]|nr:carbohydrate kinase family protein [Patescibacteria group bacterium]